MAKSLEKNVCKAFANTQRVNLLICLAKPHNVSELLMRCKLSQSALSQHLRILKEAGLVVCSRRGKEMIYKAKTTKVVGLAQMLLALSK